MRSHWFAVVAVVASVTWSAPVLVAKGHGRGHGRTKVETAEHNDKHIGKRQHAVKPAHKRAPLIAERAVVIDRDGHRRIVTQYFSGASLPPGLAKRESLPPGLQKQLRERGRLPPGLQKRLVPVPAPLASQLPGLPPHYHRYFAGRDLIVVDGRTHVIVAVIPDAVAPR